jgi:deoxyribose-phosphate aldolase
MGRVEGEKEKLMLITQKQIAKMIDHSLLHPMMTDEQLITECEVALKNDVASVCIKPYSVALAREFLIGSDVEVGTVIGFPHGNSRTDLKIRETELALVDGATEIDMVVNIGKVLSQDWDYVFAEIRRINEATVSGGAILKVIFENDFIPKDYCKIKLCEICSEVGVAFVKTSSGYGFVKQSNGMYTYLGATDDDLKLMREHSAPEVQIKAAGGVRTLDDLLRVRELGVTRVGATATELILAEAIKRGIE